MGYFLTRHPCWYSLITCLHLQGCPVFQSEKPHHQPTSPSIIFTFPAMIWLPSGPRWTVSLNFARNCSGVKPGPTHWRLAPLKFSEAACHVSVSAGVPAIQRSCGSAGSLRKDNSFSVSCSCISVRVSIVSAQQNPSILRRSFRCRVVAYVNQHRSDSRRHHQVRPLRPFPLHLAIQAGGSVRL